MEPKEISPIYILKTLGEWEESITIEDLEQKILKTLMTITNAKGGSLITSSNNSFSPKIIINNSFLEKVEKITISPLSPLAYVARTEQPLFLTDIKGSDRFKSSGYSGYIGSSLLIFPVKISDEHEIRFFTLHSPNKGNFNYKDLKLGTHLTSFAVKIFQLKLIENMLPKNSNKKAESFLGIYKSIRELRYTYHNLRNVFTPIYNYSNLLNSKKLHHSKLNKIYQNLRKASLHAYTLLKSGEKKKAIIQPERINAFRIFYNCKKMLESEKFKININITTKKISRDEICFWGNKHQIEQLIINFFKNSIESMNNEGQIQVSISYPKKPKTLKKRQFPFINYLRVTITDEGNGIDETLVKKIFKEGFSTKQTGSGIGMTSICRILKKHHGFLGIVPSKNKGASFNLYLPNVNTLKKKEFHLLKRSKIVLLNAPLN